MSCIDSKYLYNAVSSLLIESVRLLKMLRCLTLFVFAKKRVIFVRAAVKTKITGVKHFNWGDDINYYLLHLITKKKIIFLPHGKIADRISIPYYLGIGSIISFYNLNKASIIGSGLINKKSTMDLHGKPSKVYFVRGPLTRAALIEHGIACPQLYGDLALTLPLYYKPQIKKIYRIGFVLHILDEYLDSVQRLIQNYPEIKIIHMNNYKKWTDIIDEINSCEVIFSSALHGLIVSEAYKVCCQWISFNDRLGSHWDEGYSLKYLDFYESIGKSKIAPFEMNSDIDIYALAKKVEELWTPSKFDPQKLIDALPTELKQ